MVRKDIETCGMELYRRGYPWGIVSNGLLMTRERLDALLASGMHSATISLDGFEEAHNWLRRHPKSFENAVNAICMLADKEEIGSEGVTGMKSAAFDTFMEDLCQSQNVPLRACYERSFCLSADVTAAYDPNFAEVYEKRNSALVNCGMGLCKYTGARGKSGASDADAETVAYIRNLFDEAGVIWQIAELGKVDAGGGGTVAMYMANRNITTLDAGVPVLSMHAPFETVSKLDCYETYKGMKAVFQAEK